VAVALAPRLGWLAAAGACVIWLAGSGHAGLALLAGVALLPVPVLLARAAALWSLSAAAPALGFIGLACAFPAIAGQASTVVRRAALGALGAAWVVLAESVAHQRLLAGPAAGSAPRAGWEASASSALDHVLSPIGSSGLLGVCLLWAVAAAVLPWFVRGATLAADAAGATVWAAALAGGTKAMLDACAGPGTGTHARSLVGGAVLAAAVAVAAAAARTAARGGDESLA
jgi:hypothetical protein